MIGLFQNMKRLAQWCLVIARAFTKELMCVFLDLCNDQKVTPTLDYFLQWIPQITNRSYVFIFKLIWCHLIPVEVFRKGYSRNNHHYVVAAEKKMDALFFQSNHINYQRISIQRDLRRLTLRSTLLQKWVEMCRITAEGEKFIINCPRATFAQRHPLTCYI